jgi:hypothetical protein
MALKKHVDANQGVIAKKCEEILLKYPFKNNDVQLK